MIFLEQGSLIKIDETSYMVEEAYCSPGGADCMSGGGNDLFLTLVSKEDFFKLHKKEGLYWINNLITSTELKNNIERVSLYFKKYPNNLLDIIEEFKLKKR